MTPPTQVIQTNPSKTWLVTKEGLHDTAASIFASTGVKVTPDGRPYLGAAISSPDYISSHVETKVTEWAANLRRLAERASTQPHAAFCALTHGLMSKWTYLSRTIPGIGPALRILDEILGSAVIPALTGRPSPGDLEPLCFTSKTGRTWSTHTVKSCSQRIPCIPTGHLYSL